MDKGGHRSTWVAIAGSLRKSSANKGLLRAVQEIVSQEELFEWVDLEILEIGHLPFMNPDMEVEGLVPDSVVHFRQKILAAHAVIFACPEYNYSIPAVLKNALDWGSRPPNVWGDKAAAVLSVAGGSGGTRAQCHLRQVGVFLDLHFINKPHIFIRSHDGPSKFDEHGDVIDVGLRQHIHQLLISLHSFSKRLSMEPQKML